MCFDTNQVYQAGAPVEHNQVCQAWNNDEMMKVYQGEEEVVLLMGDYKVIE